LIQHTPRGVAIDVRVIPRARRTAVEEERDGAILVRVSAPPVGDAANQQLIEVLAKALGVARGQVQIVSGQKGRRKRVLVTGISEGDARRLLTASVQREEG
jgi:uncharacterized protein (TIGR00251 family)